MDRKIRNVMVALLCTFGRTLLRWSRNSSNAITFKMPTSVENEQADGILPKGGRINEGYIRCHYYRRRA